MEPTLLIIAWQCVREIALAVVANRRNRRAARAELRPQKLSDRRHTTKVSVDLEPPARLAPRDAWRRRGTCGS
jgi:hypothetical protein